MSFDLLDRLREADVPATPADIDERIHERLNVSLTTTQLIDFVCHALPAAFVEFSRPLGELLRDTAGMKRPPERPQSK